MKRLFRSFFALVIVGCLATVTVAQDFHFSQYYAAPLTMNPALTGAFYGQYRVNFNRRNQWGSIATPFRTVAISVDAPNVVNKIGLGLVVLNQTAGEAGYRNLNAAVSASYDLALSTDAYKHIVFGLQVGLNRNQFDFSKAVFADQYNNGLTNNGTQESGLGENNNNLDVNAGVLFFEGNPFRSYNPYIGFSVSHLNRPNQSFTSGVENRLPIKELVHAGIKIRASRLLEFTPQAYFTHQRSAVEFTPGLAFQYYLVESDAYVLGGVSYRVSDAAIPYVGLQYKDILVGLSYDINTSRLAQATNNQGGFELSLSYTRRSKVGKPQFICPRI